MTWFESKVWDCLEWLKQQDSTVKFFFEIAGVALLAVVLGLLCYIKL